MGGIRIVVCLKPVPDTNGRPALDTASKRLVRPAEQVINPIDEFALEAALRVREAVPESTVTVLAMAPSGARETLRKALAIGADDAVLICDDALAGSDGAKTARVLAAAMRTLAPDLVCCGTQSSDGGGGYLPAMLAERLELPAFFGARTLTVTDGSVAGECATDHGIVDARTTLPALVSVSKEFAAPRYASLKGIMAAKRKEIRIIDAAALGDIATTPSQTVVVGVEPPPARSAARVVDASDPVAGAAAVVAFLRERSLL